MTRRALLPLFVSLFGVSLSQPLSALQEAATVHSENPYEESFDIVWSTIDTRFYDRTFNGVDWLDSQSQYRSKVAGAQSDDEFFKLINTMLFELGVSHLGVVPMDDPTQLGEATVFGEATVGLDVRFVDDRLLVTRVAIENSAYAAGIRPGDEILSINGRTIDLLTAEVLEFPTPPFHARNERYMILEEIYWELLGPASENVLISYRRDVGDPSEVVLQRTARSASVVFEEGLPPTYVTSEHRFLDENTGYLRFNSFHPELLDEMAAAMELFSETDGLVIDLRGNPGGAFGVRHQLASRFVSERSVIWRYRGANGVDDIFLDPTDQPYSGHLVILVDGLSASSSEEFSGGLQAMGRATIIGQRTPGRDVVADIAVLPIGAYFVFPVAETMTVDGTVLEYRGVIPDIEVAYQREILIDGRDAQLDAALTFLHAQKDYTAPTSAIRP